MTIDREPQDNYKHVSNYVATEIQYIYEIREFIRERSQVEKEYALKLEAISKKYSTKLKERKFINVVTGKDEQPTFIKGWSTTITDLERSSKQRLEFSDKLVNMIAGPMKTLAVKKEEARKKHDEFHQLLVTELLNTYSDSDKGKESYCNQCRSLEEVMSKAAKLEDPKTKENLANEQLKWKNSKTEYLLQLALANSSTSKYWQKDYLELLKYLQTLDEGRCESMKQFLQKYHSMDDLVTDSLKEITKNSMQITSEILPSKDSASFFDEIRSQLKEPEGLQFFSVMPIDKKEYIVDSASEPFLINNYLKFKKEDDELENKISQKKKELEGLQTLVKTYTENRETGDPEEVLEKILVEIRSITTLETARTQRQAQIKEIIDSVGQEAISKIKEHKFKPSSFGISSPCDQCHTSVWGIGKVGSVCQDCSYVCHNRCEMLVPANCGDPSQEVTFRKAKKDNKASQQKAKTQSTSKVEPLSDPSLATSKASLNQKKEHKITHPEHVEETNRKGTVRRKEAIPLAPVEMKLEVQGSTVSLHHPKGTIAIALYPYEAGNSEEANIQEDELLEVIEEDNGGWVKVKNSKGEIGLVPSNYIQESSTPKEKSDTVYALYDYEGTTPEDLKLKAGEKVKVINRFEDGWWEGMVEDRKGMFPSNYVTTKQIAAC